MTHVISPASSFTGSYTIDPSGSGFPITLVSPNLLVTPNGEFVYSLLSTQFSVIKTAAPAAVTPSSPFTLGNGGASPFHLACTPDGKTVYIGSISATSASIPGQVNVIPTSNNIEFSGPGFPIPTGGIGSNPTVSIAITPNGKFAYAGIGSSNSVAKIDLSNNSIVNPSIATGDVTADIAITPDSKTVYVVNFMSTPALAVTPIDVATDIPQGNIALAGIAGAFSIAITPDQAPAANFTITPAASQFPSTFDASLSATATGTIVSYAWDFGDATPVVTATAPITSHIYAKGGTFPVTLTVTNSAGTSTTQTFTGHTVSNQGLPRARITKSITIPETSIQFSGEIIKQHASTYILKTNWKNTASSDVAFYEIFANDTRIAKISASSHAHFTKVLDTRDFYKDHTSKYLKFLDKKYKIRAVNSNGSKSDFVFLEVKRVSTSNKKKLHSCQSQVPGVLQGIIPATR